MLSEDEGALKGLRRVLLLRRRPGHRDHHPRPGHRRRDSGVAAPGGARGLESTGPGGHEQAPRPLSAAVHRARTAALSGCHAAPFHQDRMPRTVLVDYLKTLFAFHLALYHLRMMKLLPAAVEASTIPVTCRKGHNSRAAADRCPYRVRLFLDADGAPGTRSAALAEHSADIWYRRANPPLHPGDLPGEETRRLRRVPRPTHQRLASDGTTSPRKRRCGCWTRSAAKTAMPAFLQRVNRIGARGGHRPPELKQIIQLRSPPSMSTPGILMHYRGLYSGASSSSASTRCC